MQDDERPYPHSTMPTILHRPHRIGGREEKVLKINPDNIDCVVDTAYACLLVKFGKAATEQGVHLALIQLEDAFFTHFAWIELDTHERA
ncbi:MAG: hypothetical protein JNK34_02150 [Tabrizicola sp.]|nr:hypothetical protein [Tabrizicola sp.]